MAVHTERALAVHVLVERVQVSPLWASGSRDPGLKPGSTRSDGEVGRNAGAAFDGTRSRFADTGQRHFAGRSLNPRLSADLPGSWA